MDPKGLVVDHVLPGPARQAGIKAGDRILRVNGHVISDELEYRFFSSEEWIEIEICRSKTGERWTKRFRGYRNLGLVFVPWEPVRCSNQCIFCFVDQLPSGMRPSLYFKDEDYRLSFLTGNFVTFSTVTDTVLQKIRTMRLSPLYVSVHATDSGVRNSMLGRKQSRNILKVIESLTRGGITIHTQVVLCPGINDGVILDRTIHDLVEFYPDVGSLAIVPVGLTKFRRSNGLFHLRPVTRDYCRQMISKISAMQTVFAAEHGNPFVFLSDEFYVRACRPFPSYATYGNFPQLENGVGMVPRFIHACEYREKEICTKPAPRRSRPAVVVTGKLAYPYVARYVRNHIESRGYNVQVLEIPNNFFGPTVTVTGLLTAGDLIGSLRSVIKKPQVLLVPDVMVKQDGDLFLDNISISELADVLHVDVRKFEPHPDGFETVLCDAVFRA